MLSAGTGTCLDGYYLADRERIEERGPKKVKYVADVVVHLVYSLGFSAAVDFYLAVYPAIVLFHLQMSMRKKFCLSIALGFGSM